MSDLFSFPNPVNETSARVVAGGVVAMATGAVALDQPWLMVPLAYGFAARVATGPKLSPLGQIATRVVTPRLRVRHRFSPGPPKRLAQAMGLAMSGGAVAMHYGFRRPRAAKSLMGALIGAAGLEAAFGLCLACKLFGAAMKAGLVPESVCAECADVSKRIGAGAGAPLSSSTAAA
ncbi:MAG TPA: DUF4395 domain-containing protein [Acidimicrobiales bacterium]|nr:DUF4395 domain-containing protein [Acidimicrobiales bacterium]